MTPEVTPIPIRRRFPLTPFAQIKMTAGSPYLVKGFIPREGLAVVWGPPKCGKSFWVYDVVMHVALGWEYRGRRVAQGTVVYIAAEGERGLGARTEAFRAEKFTEEMPDVPFYLLTTRLDLGADHTLLIADIRAQLGDSGCAAIVSEEGTPATDSETLTRDPKHRSSISGTERARECRRRKKHGLRIAVIELFEDPEIDELVSRGLVAPTDRRDRYALGRGLGPVVEAAFEALKRGDLNVQAATNATE
jgi:hypothetical protein